MPRLVGPSKAKELIFTARILDGLEAENIGLVNYVVEQNEEGNMAYNKALELASEMLPQGPIAIAMAKNAINRGIEVTVLSILSELTVCEQETWVRWLFYTKH